MRGLRDRFGRSANLALFEAPGDQPQHARWHFVCASSSAVLAQRQRDELLDAIATRVDARVSVRSRRELSAAARSNQEAYADPAESPVNRSSEAVLDEFFARSVPRPREGR